MSDTALFAREVAYLACNDHESNHPDRTGAEIVEQAPGMDTELARKVAKTLYRNARSARHRNSTEDIVDAFDDISGLIDKDIHEDFLLDHAPALAGIAYAGQRWYKTLYRQMREYAGLPVVELPYEARKQAAMASLASELDAQRLLHRDIVHVRLAADAVWKSTTDEIKLVCGNGHTFEMTPHAIRVFLQKRGHLSLCPECRENRRSAKKFQGHSFGYRHVRADTYECLTCGTEQERPQVAFQRSSICKGCLEDGMENETVWAALDKQPYCNAFVWVGRMPSWVFETQHLVDIEPVWAEVNTIQPSSFFQTQEKRRGRLSFDGDFDPIGRLDVYGINWKDMNVPDVLARALTVKGRKVRGTWALPRAIDYIAGRDPKSRYAGDAGFFPLNTYHNPEFLGWENGMPRYAFEVESSPLANVLLGR